MILEINNLSKKYGDKKALNKFSCKFTEGIYGLLGPNGAGKSTFMNILVDAIDRSSGEILYNGKETISMGKDYRNLIGYMPQQQGVYDSFTVAEFLDYIAGLKGLKKTEAKKRIEEVLKFVNLYDVKNKKLKSLAFPAALSAMLGITEPAIFGINLRYIKPFIGAALGGAAGGLYASIVGLGATGTGVTGIFGILLHLHSPINYIIMFAIALGVAFFTTLLLGWDESK